jgi:hypothetical protein
MLEGSSHTLHRHNDATPPSIYSCPSCASNNIINYQASPVKLLLHKPTHPFHIFNQTNSHKPTTLDASPHTLHHLGIYERNNKFGISTNST